MVNTGVNNAARLTISTTWAIVICQIAVSGPIATNEAIEATRPIAPGITRTRAPRAS